MMVCRRGGVMMRRGMALEKVDAARTEVAYGRKDVRDVGSTDMHSLMAQASEHLEYAARSLRSILEM